MMGMKSNLQVWALTKIQVVLFSDRQQAQQLRPRRSHQMAVGDSTAPLLSRYREL